MATNENRIDRLEQIVHVLAEGHVELEEGLVALRKIVAELATETRRGFDRVAEQFAETDRHMRETDAHMRETDAHMRETDAHMRETDARMRESSRQSDERVDKLVSAMGAYLRRLDG